MDYRQLGRAGIRVSALCLGTYNFGGPTPKAEGIKIIQQGLDAGINFVDTANVYHLGGSESVVAEAIKGRRDDVVLATKVHGTMGPGVNQQGNGRASILRECEASLKRLKTDYIDLYQLHRDDARVPLEETMSALDSLVRAGKVRHIGTSNFTAWRLAKSRWISSASHLEVFASEQPPYNMVERQIERELIPACVELGIGLIPYSPLAMGLLTDRYVGGKTPAKARFTEWFSPKGALWEPARTAVDKLHALAGELGTSLIRMAHAWVRDSVGVTSAIIGPRTSTQLKEALASNDVVLDANARRAIDEICPPGGSLWMRIAEAAQR